ncbi:MAG: SufE family protein [Flavobacteriaceae bacterium]|nr:SufE family protein [Flavobacteriaceae bacterium]
MDIKTKQQHLVDDFSFFEDWADKYEHLIELGKTLPELEATHKIEENIIKGCQSRVWLTAEMKDGKVYYKADSDAIITKGIVALLVDVFSGQPPEAILNAETDFIDQIGLKEHLSPTRANGLVAMVKQLKLYALAFQTKQT